MTVWEYFYDEFYPDAKVNRDIEVEEWLERHGNDRWELVHFADRGATRELGWHFQAVFKRPQVIPAPLENLFVARRRREAQ